MITNVYAESHIHTLSCNNICILSQLRPFWDWTQCVFLSHSPWRDGCISLFVYKEVARKHQVLFGSRKGVIRISCWLVSHVMAQCIPNQDPLIRSLCFSARFFLPFPVVVVFLLVCGSSFWDAILIHPCYILKPWDTLAIDMWHLILLRRSVLDLLFGENLNSYF